MSQNRDKHLDSDQEVVTDWRMIGIGAGIGGCFLLALGCVLVWMTLWKSPEPPSISAQAKAEQTRWEARPIVVGPSVMQAIPPSLQQGAEEQPGAPRPKAVARKEVLKPQPTPRNEPKVKVEPVATRAEEPVSQEEFAPTPPFPSRLDFSNETQLADQLLDKVPELDLDKVADTSKNLFAKAARETKADDKLLAEVLKTRKDLSGLPFQMGEKCRTASDDAKNLQQYSRPIRASLSQFNREERTFRRTVSYSEVWDTRKTPTTRTKMILGSDVMLSAFHRDAAELAWAKPEAVSAMTQILQAEEEAGRLGLTQMLAKLDYSAISTVRAEKAGIDQYDVQLERARVRTTHALAQRAVFDLSEIVRKEAIEALKKRPAKDYQPFLLQGLRHPWAPAAEHAAEALILLRDRSVVSELVEMLDLPSPIMPVKRSDGKWEAPQLVRVNHMRNCLLCHAASFDAKDPVRGLIPTPGEPLPRVYYESRKGNFVRADIVYLRQDFSVMQAVEDHKPWPKMQRFDYIVRKQELTEEEAKTQIEVCSVDVYPQRQALLTALRCLTQRDAGTTSEAWNNALADEEWYHPKTKD